MKSTLLFATLLLISQITGSRVEAQGNREIRGIVTCFKNIPLKNVKVSADKSGKTVLSDSSGQFAILVMSKDVLQIKAAGFKEKKIKTGKNILYQVNLSYANKENSFDEAVRNKHIGEETLQKAIYANLSGSTKDYSHYDDIYELIDSEIYEVNVKGSSVTNKKVKSFDSNPQVLYVVDEKIVSDISYLNPGYVKSIEFVEDVGATMYGSKGANGVLKIWLK